MLTQAELKARLYYDPFTGVFTWISKKNKLSRVAIGSKAGSYPVPGTLTRYATLGLNGKVYKLHRLAFLYMTGKFPSDQVDHINQLTIDNRWCNLRQADTETNKKNTRVHRYNTSGLMGVTRVYNRDLWVARINRNKERIVLGFYKNLFEACCARKSAELEYGYHQNHGSIRPL